MLENRVQVADHAAFFFGRQLQIRQIGHIHHVLFGYFCFRHLLSRSGLFAGPRLRPGLATLPPEPFTAGPDIATTNSIRSTRVLLYWFSFPR